MKLGFCKLVLILLVLSAFVLILASCGDTPDTPPDTPPVTENPPEQPPIEEQIKVGMTYYDVVCKLGTEGDFVDRVNNVYAYRWNAPSDTFLYVYFDASKTLSGSIGNATVTHYVKADSFEPQENMTYNDICNLLFGIQGTKCSDIANIYVWNLQKEEKLYIWFGDESATPDKLIYKKHKYLNDIEIDIGMTYDEISYICDSSGEQMDSESNFYRWKISDKSYLFIQFTEDMLAKSVVYRSTPICDGMTYSSIVDIYNFEGMPIDISDEILKWELGDEDLYVRFDSNKIAARVIYASEIIYSGMKRAEVIDILGTPDYYGSSQLRWSLNDEKEFLVQFEAIDSERYLEAYFLVPNLKIELGMTLDEVQDVMGSEGELYWIAASGLFDQYRWFVDDLTIKVKFDRPDLIVSVIYIEQLIQEPEDP